jgi:hypothetical protein
MASNDITEEIKDLQSNVALSLLNELKTKNQITAETYKFPPQLLNISAEIFRAKFTKLHELIVYSFQNHKNLHTRAKKLKTVPTFYSLLIHRIFSMSVPNSTKPMLLNLPTKKSLKNSIMSFKRYSAAV